MTLAECEVARKMFWHWTWVMHMLVILMASNKICCWNDGRPCYECYSAVLQSIHLSLTSKPVSLTPLLHINMLWLFPKIWKIHFVQDMWIFWSFIHSFTMSLLREMKSPEGVLHFVICSFLPFHREEIQFESCEVLTWLLLAELPRVHRSGTWGKIILD